MIYKVELKKFKKYKNNTILLKKEGISILVGGNNAGKSTLLHAISVWEFCKLILTLEKGEESLYQEKIGQQGFGLSADEFLPIAVPSLKHLWTNLKTQKVEDEEDGYNLKIKCFWKNDDEEKYLEISLALTNDRLFLKVTESNIKETNKIPTVAYLPTFAGILTKENKVTLAERRGLVGKGLAGSILRNLLLELYIENQKKRKKLKGDKSKILNSQLKLLRKSDSFELLLTNIRDIFRTDLRIKEFNDLYHTSIKIESFRGEYKNKRFIKFPNYNYRDLMVEGSGFLQWLNVFTLSLNPEIDIVLLDEPDAHLHPSLQLNMIKELEKICKRTKKQVLIATHSSEIIKSVSPQKILDVNNKPKYLKMDKQKVSLLAGLGAEYSPILDKLKKTKKVIFIEGEIDFELLKKVSKIMNQEISKEIIPWVISTGHKERKYLYEGLKREIDGLKCFSIRDRDDDSISHVSENLVDKEFYNKDDNLKIMKWKRRNIEGYLLLPYLIAKIKNIALEEIKNHFSNKFGLAINDDFKNHNVPDTLLQTDGKKILETDDNSIEKIYKISKHDIIDNLEDEYICDDLKTMVKAINSHFEDN